MRAGAFILAALIGISSPAFAIPADCQDPGPAPKAPDGKTATKEDLLAARQKVLDYQTQIDAILACWDKRRDFDFDVMNQDQQKRWNEDYSNINKMLENAQIDFNVSVRAYKAKHPAPPSDDKPQADQAKADQQAAPGQPSEPTDEVASAKHVAVPAGREAPPRAAVPPKSRPPEAAAASQDVKSPS